MQEEKNIENIADIKSIYEIYDIIEKGDMAERYRAYLYLVTDFIRMTEWFDRATIIAESIVLENIIRREKITLDK